MVSYIKQILQYEFSDLKPNRYLKKEEKKSNANLMGIITK